MRDLIHRIGATEVAVARLQTKILEHEETLKDHEPRIRKTEHIIAKMIGACIVGSALGNVVLSLVKGG